MSAQIGSKPALPSLPRPVLQSSAVTSRGNLDTITEVIDDTSYSLTTIPADYFSFMPDPKGYLFGTNTFLFKARNKRIPETVECGQIFRKQGAVRVKGAMVYGIAGIKGTPDIIYLKAYSVGPDSTPAKLLAKGKVDMRTVEKDTLYTTVYFDYGDAFVYGADFVVSVDYSQIVDDTLIIVNSYKLDSLLLPTADLSIQVRLSSFLAGRWGSFDRAYLGANYGDGYNGRFDADLVILPIVERDAKPLTQEPFIKENISISVNLPNQYLKINGLPLPINSRYKIYSSTLQEIATGELYDEYIPLENYSDGIYYLLLDNEQYRFSKPFIITTP
ncbi:MAG: hypothetical protein IT244_09275 [Bacteroidia bacterium]|nr:hypothetical protein [Bacteroidia bacterium]